MIRTEVVPLGEVFEGELIPEGLTNGRLHIPPIQREYQWGPATESDKPDANRSAAQFLEDSLNFFEISEGDDVPDPYFMGTMIVYREEEDEEGVYRLMDGQQRWTTAMAMMAVIWHFLDRDSQNDWDLIMRDIEDHFLLTSQSPPLPKLTSHRDYDDFTIRRLCQFDGTMDVGDLDPSEEYPESPVKVYDGGEYTGTNLFCVLSAFSDRIEQYFGLTTGADSRERLVRFYKCARDQLFVNLTLAPSSSVAYRMFITANARGTQLNNFDIFKALAMKKEMDLNLGKTIEFRATLERANQNLTNYHSHSTRKGSSSGSLIDGVMADITGVIMGQRVSKSSVMMFLDNHLKKIDDGDELTELVEFVEKYTRVLVEMDTEDNYLAGKRAMGRVSYGLGNFKQHIPIYVTAVVRWATWDWKWGNTWRIWCQDNAQNVDNLAKIMECYMMRTVLTTPKSSVRKPTLFFWNNASRMAHVVYDGGGEPDEAKRICKEFSDGFEADGSNPATLDGIENMEYLTKDGAGGNYLLGSAFYALCRFPIAMPKRKGAGARTTRKIVALAIPYKGPNRADFSEERVWDYGDETSGGGPVSMSIGNMFLLNGTWKDIKAMPSGKWDERDAGGGSMSDEEIIEVRMERFNDLSINVDATHTDWAFSSWDWNSDFTQERTEMLIASLEERYPLDCWMMGIDEHAPFYM